MLSGNVTVVAPAQVNVVPIDFLGGTEISVGDFDANGAALDIAVAGTKPNGDAGVRVLVWDATQGSYSVGLTETLPAAPLGFAAGDIRADSLTGSGLSGAALHDFAVVDGSGDVRQLVGRDGSTTAASLPVELCSFGTSLQDVLYADIVPSMGNLLDMAIAGRDATDSFVWVVAANERGFSQQYGLADTNCPGLFSGMTQRVILDGTAANVNEFFSLGVAYENGGMPLYPTPIYAYGFSAGFTFSGLSCPLVVGFPLNVFPAGFSTQPLGAANALPLEQFDVLGFTFPNLGITDIYWQAAVTDQNGALILTNGLRVRVGQ